MTKKHAGLYKIKILEREEEFYSKLRRKYEKALITAVNLMNTLNVNFEAFISC